MSSKGFESWAIVELFGHQQIAGFVSEAEIGGGSFIRVDVPAVNREGVNHEGCTKYFGPSAIYAIHPCEDLVAREAAERIERRRAPVPVRVPSLEPPREGPVLIGPGEPWEEVEDDGRLPLF
jgi:hypothetical protein